MITPDYAAYYDHALRLNTAEEQLREMLMPRIPTSIIDVHTHAARPEDVDLASIPDHVQRHMVSTYPYTTLEQSKSIDELLMPDKDVRKIRFAHAFPGIGHAAVNEYLKSEQPDGDKTALFGISDSEAEVEYTIGNLDSGAYNGLKMYYMASVPPKNALYDYFPPPILEAAQRQQTPIILHLPNSLSNSMHEVQQLHNDFPGLPVILAHVGVTFLPHGKHDGTMKELAKISNTYVDTSGVYSSEVIAVALKHLGPGRLLYGSDEPLSLLRDQYYDNPQLGSRLITDYPYHWVNPEERAKYIHLAKGEFVHGHWRQLQAILDACSLVGYNEEQASKAQQMIFYDNAKKLFDL